MDKVQVKPSWAESEAESSSTKSKQSGQGGQWQALNVGPDIAKSLLLRGFKNPTPIQRASIPSALASPPRDILGMARTGSGKTLAYLIPLLQRLGSEHSTSGTRSLVICPNRELAVQILKVGKDLARGLRKGKSKANEGLRWALVIGGEGLEDQFEAMSNSPDIVIATPGRFLHLIVEMQLDLRQVQMVVYDEADRLFEMGFETQLREIVHRLPSSRQNLLFSATLPSLVAEFAKAGLVNPLLVRLDVDQKISPDLDLRFFFVKPIEKEASLLVLLRELIGLGRVTANADKSTQAIVFTSTKHHVDYLAELLRATGYLASYIYSSLDQTARHQQLNAFRNGSTNILVVTDIAARGLDIPVMDHVVNYDFPPGPRVFVHRVGRTARAGRRGTAWSLVSRDDLPYLIDLQAFLGPARVRSLPGNLETLPFESVSSGMEYVNDGVVQTTSHITALRDVMCKGQAMYERSRGKASAASYKTAKLIGREISQRIGSGVNSDPAHLGESTLRDSDIKQAQLIAKLTTFQPSETVFEIGRRGDDTSAAIMKRRRLTIEKRQVSSKPHLQTQSQVDDKLEASSDGRIDSKSFQDPSFYLNHKQSGLDTERGLSLRSGASVPDSLSAAAMDLQVDEGSAVKAQKASQISWDRKKRKFVQKPGNAENGATVRSESGALLPASYSSGRFKEWKARRHRDLPNGSQPNESSTFTSQRKHRHSQKGSGSSSHATGTGLLSPESINRKKRDMNTRQSKHGSKKRTR